MVGMTWGYRGPMVGWGGVCTHRRKPVPLTIARPHHAPRATPLPAQPKPPACIVVINDDTDFLTLMSELLAEVEGYEVKICREGNRAYKFVKETLPDLVILDIRIDGQEVGWTILECLTLDPQTRPIPTIVCSAAIRELQDHQPMLDTYGIDVLPKPFDLDALLEKVNDGLSRAERHQHDAP